MSASASAGAARPPWLVAVSAGALLAVLGSSVARAECSRVEDLQRLGEMTGPEAFRTFRATLFSHVAPRPPDEECALHVWTSLAGVLQPSDGCPLAIVRYAGDYSCGIDEPEPSYAAIVRDGRGWRVLEGGLPEDDPRVRSATSELPDLDGDGLREWVAITTHTPGYRAFSEWLDIGETVEACALPETRAATLTSSRGGALAGPLVVEGADPIVAVDRAGLPAPRRMPDGPTLRCPRMRRAWFLLVLEALDAGRDDAGYYLRARVERRACRGLLEGDSYHRVRGAGRCAPGDVAIVEARRGAGPTAPASGREAGPAPGATPEGRR